MNRKLKVGLYVAGIAAAVCASIVVVLVATALILEQRRLPAQDFGPIVYKSRDGLCSIDPMGAGPPNCSKIFLGDPSYSPDGQFIAGAISICSKDGPPPCSKIVVRGRNGAQVADLTGSQDYHRPVWAPDGQSIYAISYHLPAAAGRWPWPVGQMAVVPVEGLEEDCRPIQSISFSSSGRKATVMCDFKRIYVVDVFPNLLRVERPLPLSFSYVALPEWLDDERLLLVAKTPGGGSGKVWSVDTRSGATSAVAIVGLYFRGDLTISPDRRSVLVTAMATSAKEIAWSVWRAELDSGKTMRLTRGVEDVSPTWAR
jgi:dipeptidyl aminopeptidase/acylaminoacyl peptidase